MRHLKFSIIVLAILFSACSLFAQNDSVSYNSQVQVHLINGYSLSYLKSLTDKSAFRLKVDLGFSINDGSSDENIGADLSSRLPGTTNSTERKNNSELIAIVAQYLTYPYKVSDLRLFWGGGPFISFNRDFYQTTVDFDPPQSSSQNKTSENSKNESYSFGIGINSVIGIECFVTNKISIVAEYGLSACYSWMKGKYSNVLSDDNPITSYSNEISGTNWEISLSNVKIGFTYHF